MNPNPRQSELMAEVRARGSVSVEALADRFGIAAKRAHLYKNDKGHGFISSQREGSDQRANQKNQLRLGLALSMPL